MLAALALVIWCAGCSFQLGSLLENGKDEQGSGPTGSVAKRPASAARPDAGDLAAARSVAAELLSRGTDASLPWENPRTGARGTVTPIASAYDQDGVTCRDFLASYVRQGDEAWLQGEACRNQQQHWEVRSLKPWSRS
jgi:surface antigen